MIMSEVYEHADDEIVSIENIDLRHEFDKLNNMLFNGELTNVPLSWSRTKAKYGHVEYRYNRATRMPIKINGLFITAFFKITYRKFKDIFAHEMIHVKNIQDSMRNRTPRYKSDAHGYEFIKELNRINSMGLGFNVTDKEYDSHEVSDDVKGKELYIGVLRLEGIKSGTFIFCMEPSAYTNKRQDIITLFNNLILQGKYKSFEVKFFKVNAADSAYFQKFKIQKNFNTLYYRPIQQSDLDKLNQVGTELDSYSSKKPEPVKPEKPEISDEMKDINRKVMAIFKSTTDKTAQEKLFDILQTTEPIKKQMKIDSYNQSLGPKYGFIEE